MTESQRYNTHGKVFFLQCRAGTGEKYLQSVLRDIYDRKGEIVQMTITTDIAAFLYEEGRTLHSLIGLGVDDTKGYQIRQRRKLSKIWPSIPKGRSSKKGISAVD